MDVLHFVDIESVSFSKHLAMVYGILWVIFFFKFIYLHFIFIVLKFQVSNCLSLVFIN